jgi:hypothetical protein
MGNLLTFSGTVLEPDRSVGDEDPLDAVSTLIVRGELPFFSAVAATNFATSTSDDPPLLYLLRSGVVTHSRD